MDWLGWATFGFGATAALTSIMVGAQLLGISRMDMPMMLGTAFTGRPGPARVIGAIVHLLNGQAFGLLYVGAFAALGWATWWLGALFGLGHGIAALVLIMPLLPGAHPRMASERSGPELGAHLEPPGFFGLNYGRATPIVTLVAHVVFGGLLGFFISPH
ncbi:MAG: hypothetical protein KY429_07725 [Actinobacteria bacterium]|nr:hypothetical protein [Actinomycetota bacterium]